MNLQEEIKQIIEEGGNSADERTINYLIALIQRREEKAFEAGKNEACYLDGCRERMLEPTFNDYKNSEEYEQ